MLMKSNEVLFTTYVFCIPSINCHKIDTFISYNNICKVVKANYLPLIK